MGGFLFIQSSIINSSAIEYIERIITENDIVIKIHLRCAKCISIRTLTEKIQMDIYNDIMDQLEKMNKK